MDPRSVGEDGERHHPEVQSDHGTCSGFRFRNLPLGLEGDGPPARLPGHGGIPEIALERPGNPDLDPSDLGEEDPGMV